MPKRQPVCAPSKRGNEACYSLEQLQLIAAEYNKDPATVKKISVLNDYTQLLHQLHDRLRHKCDDHACWLTLPYVANLADEAAKQEFYSDTFRPNGPKGKYTWLNTINIDEVSRQYEKVYKDFAYLGALPVDFAEVPWLNLAPHHTRSLLERLHSEGRYKVGAVINLDEHNKPGSHWVGLFANMREGTVFYFDSYGKSPDKRIDAFMDGIAKFIESKGVAATKDYNRLCHQYSNSECGLYSLNFVMRMAENQGSSAKLFKRFTSERVPDELMTKLRERLFMPHKG